MRKCKVAFIGKQETFALKKTLQIPWVRHLHIFDAMVDFKSLLLQKHQALSKMFQIL